MKHSPEEVKAWREKMGEIAKRVRLMSREEREALAERNGFLTCEGHRLSPYNTCYLLYQGCPWEAGAMVGGFRQWERAGRYVRAGEHAVGYIYVPMGGGKQRAEGDGNESDEKESLRFTLVPMFSLTQTEIVGEPAAVAA